MATWKEKYIHLVYNLESAKDAYFTLENYRTYPELQDRFRNSYSTYLKFSKILRHEAGVHNLAIDKDPGKDRRIFESLALTTKEKNLSAQELEQHRIKRESLLLEKYREVLAAPDLPILPATLLQFQAEELNGKLYALELDHWITYPVDDLVYS